MRQDKKLSREGYFRICFNILQFRLYWNRTLCVTDEKQQKEDVHVADMDEFKKINNPVKLVQFPNNI